MKTGHPGITADMRRSFRPGFRADSIYHSKQRENKSERSLLSVPDDGSRADLFSADDGSGRQRWLIEKLPDGPVHVRSLGGVQNDRRLLNVTSDDDYTRWLSWSNQLSRAVT